MNTNKLKTKKIIIPAVAAVAILGVGGGVAVAATAGDDDELTGDAFDRASKVALAEVGEGKVTAAERSDDGDPDTYEIEVTRADGSEADVLLDQDFKVIGTEDDRTDHDDRDDDGDEADDDSDSDADGNRNGDADDRALSADERRQASRAATAEVAGAVTDVDASDDRVGGKVAAYEVEVSAKGGAEWTVWLDDSYTVLDKSRDD